MHKQELHMKKIEDEVKMAKKIQEELKALIDSSLKKSFNLKDNGYEVQSYL